MLVRRVLGQVRGVVVTEMVGRDQVMYVLTVTITGNRSGKG